MRKITKKSNAYILQKLLLLSMRHLCISISWTDSFHFMTQKYQNFRCRVKRTGPKSPILLFYLMLEKIGLQKKGYELPN
jgi:hypothetical protein